MTPTPVSPGRRGDRRTLLTWSAVVAVSVALALAASWIYTRDDYWSRRWTVDLTVYLASGETVREGASLYDLVIISPLYGEMPYLYPPLTALLFFVPLSFLPVGAASLVWNSASLVALGAVVWLSLGIAGVRDDRTRSVLTVVGLVLAACLLPVRIQLIAGQINMFLLLLVLLDFSRRSDRLRGVGIGIAAGLKITPLIFIVYLLVTRRWAAARNALAAFLATVAVGFLVLPGDAARYWGGLVFHSSRAGGVFDTPNQSLARRDGAGAVQRAVHELVAAGHGGGRAVGDGRGALRVPPRFRPPGVLGDRGHRPAGLARELGAPLGLRDPAARLAGRPVPPDAFPAAGRGHGGTGDRLHRPGLHARGHPGVPA
ncbi:glycosyltransferase 87 family protein [Streptomyces radiopugnans]|nr:glycosyltransferase 87 family protein [Streptomyces radiopugnans]